MLRAYLKQCVPVPHVYQVQHALALLVEWQAQVEPVVQVAQPENVAELARRVYLGVTQDTTNTLMTRFL